MTDTDHHESGFAAAATPPLASPIVSERLALRPMDEADIDRVVSEIGDFAVARMLSRVPYPYTPADAARFLAVSRQRAEKDLILLITLDGDVIGGIGLTGMSDERQFGYWLGRRYWGQGFATEAGRAFLAFVFDRLGLDVVHSGVFADNPASLRVQEKLGLQRIGMRRLTCLSRGVAVDHIDTILTRQRHAAIRGAGR